MKFFWRVRSLALHVKNTLSQRHPAKLHSGEQQEDTTRNSRRRPTDNETRENVARAVKEYCEGQTLEQEIEDLRDAGFLEGPCDSVSQETTTIRRPDQRRTCKEKCEIHSKRKPGDVRSDGSRLNFNYHNWDAPWWKAVAMLQQGTPLGADLLEEIKEHEKSSCPEIWQICRAILDACEGKPPGRFGRWVLQPNVLLLSLYTKTGRKRKYGRLKRG